MSKETKSYMKKIIENSLVVATLLGLASFDLRAQTSIPALQCPSCTSSDLGWVQNREECFANDAQTGFPVKEEITYKGCAIPANYSEYCANGDPNRCKLLNPIRPPSTNFQMVKAIIGWCPYGTIENTIKVCKSVPRYRTSLISVTTEYSCQIDTFQKHCNAVDGLLGQSVSQSGTTLVGKEVVKSVVSNCSYFDDPPCALSCGPGYPPWRGGGGSSGPSPGPGWPIPGGGGPGGGGPGGGGPGGGGPGGPGGSPPAGPITPGGGTMPPGTVPNPITGTICPSGWTFVNLPKNECSPPKKWFEPFFGGKPFKNKYKQWVYDSRKAGCCVKNPESPPQQFNQIKNTMSTTTEGQLMEPNSSVIESQPRPETKSSRTGRGI